MIRAWQQPKFEPATTTVMVWWLQILIILLLPKLLPGCNPAPVAPATHVQSTSGGNNSLTSESLFHSIKTVATVNLSGAAGAIISICFLFVVAAATYRKLIDFIHLVNNRIHNVSNLLGIDGFHHEFPAAAREAATVAEHSV